MLKVADELLMMDHGCPLYLSSPRDPNCVPKVVTTTKSPTTNHKHPTSSVLPQPTSISAECKDKNNDSTNIPILIACLIGGVFLGCF